MRVLILGSLGMLGRALVAEGQRRNYTVLGIDIADKKHPLDITRKDDFEKIYNFFNPEIIINTVAIVDLALCENNPCKAYLVNCRPISHICDTCQKNGTYFIQISTDHFYVNDGRKKHSETDKIIIVNEYARTKFLAEQLAMLYSPSLIIRTNIVGLKEDELKPTFVEWFINELKNGNSIKLFYDYFTSSIDVVSFSVYLFNLIEMKITGLLNLASSTVSSKKEFIELVASKLELSLNNSIVDSCLSMTDVRRANSLGLDVSKAEKLLGQKLPDISKVAENIVSEIKKRGLV